MYNRHGNMVATLGKSGAGHCVFLQERSFAAGVPGGGKTPPAPYIETVWVKQEVTEALLP